MSIILLTSTAGAPGVTTTALAMTMTWPRPVLLIEADVTRYSAVMPGFFQGQIQHSRGMNELAVVAAREGLTPSHLYGQSLPLDDARTLHSESQRRVLPGFRDPAGAASWNNLWGYLASVAGVYSSSGVDVIIDAGRWLPADRRTPLLAQADAAIVMVRPDLSSVVATNQRIPAMKDVLETTGSTEALTLLCAATPRSPRVSAREIEGSLGVKVLSSLSWDPTAAEIFTSGEGGARYQRSKLASSIRLFQTLLQSRLDARRDVIDRTAARA